MASYDDHPQTPCSSTQNGTNWNPGTVWLITPRTKPAWIAASAVLDDGNWHPREDVIETMRAAGLARRTTHNHLRSASRRGWIRCKSGKVKIRDRQAIETALEDCS